MRESLKRRWLRLAFFHFVINLDGAIGWGAAAGFLAQALAQQPKVLLLDEPTNHLDLTYQKELLDLIKKMTKQNRLTGHFCFSRYKFDSAIL